MQFRARLLEWSHIEKWCETLRKKIIDSYEPDFIIGLSRGGLAPARILSDTLLVKDLFSLKTEHWGMTANVDGKAKLKNSETLDVKGRKVLVVDDITDTGESMELAKNHVETMGPEDLKTATMLHITRSKHVPSFYAEEVSESQWTWFIFPWNVTEDLNNLIRKIGSEVMTSEEIISGLKREFDLHVKAEILEFTLKRLQDLKRIRKDGSNWKLN